MLKRTITALVATAALIPVLIFSKTIILPMAIATVITIALYEMFNCLRMKDRIAMTLPAYVMGIALPIYAKLSGGFVEIVPFVTSVIMIYLIYLLFVAVLIHKKYTINDAALIFITSVYIIGGISSISFLRTMFDSDVYLLVFVGAWSTDIFAYFTGRLFGKHKLCEAISPKKTVEGSIGGIFFCSLAFVIFAMITSGVDKSIGYYLMFAFVGVIASIVSQIGDLTMSLIKRQYKIKDFGKLFPGHGGVLDRFDSIIAIALILFIVLSALTSLNLITII